MRATSKDNTNFYDEVGLKVWKIDIVETNIYIAVSNTITLHLTADSTSDAEWEIIPNLENQGGAYFEGSESGASVDINAGSLPTNYMVKAYATVFTNCFDTCSVTVVKVEFKNPIDSDSNGHVDDFASSTTNRTGNAFNYDRNVTNTCVIPCRVQIQPDTEDIRSLFTDKITVNMDEISHAGFTSTLTWDHSVTGAPETGSLVYNSTSGLWIATANFEGLPAVPSNSWGRVPEGLRDLLYGQRSAVVTVQQPSGTGAFCNALATYEVYFGDSLVINGTNMAETTLNYSNHITALVGTNILRREIYEKMNCSTETFSFTNDSNASQNFTMRCKAVDVMDGMDNGGIDVGYSDPYPRCGNTTFNTTTTNWNIGTYWQPVNTNNPYCNVFSELSGTTAHDAINNVTPFRGECAGAMEICIFMAADFALGASQFNAIHPSGSLGLADWGADFDTHSQNMSDTNTLVPGDYIYMQNQDDYINRATNNPALWQGENCVYQGLNSADDGTFGGLGDGMSYLTEAEMRQALKDGYERDCPSPGVTNALVEIRFTDRSRIQTGN